MVGLEVVSAIMIHVVIMVERGQEDLQYLGPLSPWRRACQGVSLLGCVHSTRLYLSLTLLTSMPTA